ncbi:MAG: KH domain-containing protein [Bacillales bacterium]|nr:KH domain-containing protein [Bacillales bacterium]
MRYTGKTLEEVIEKAAKEEYVSKEDLVYEVVSNLEETVEIEVYTIVDVIEYAQEYLKSSIEALGLECKVIPSIKDDIIHLKIDSDHNSILIGKNGKTLQALNELTRIAISNHFKHRYRILLDINGYKDDKYDRLVKMSRRIAHEVQKTHQTVTLDPMPADERRMIHNALTNMPHIKTESTGAGKSRQIQIIYID